MGEGGGISVSSQVVSCAWFSYYNRDMTSHPGILEGQCEMPFSIYSATKNDPMMICLYSEFVF